MRSLADAVASLAAGLIPRHDWRGIDLGIADWEADWTAGTFVVTADGCFRLGEPFDRPTPHGIRTVYPLTALQSLEVLRKGVAYELPPLRPYTPRRKGPADESPRPLKES